MPGRKGQKLPLQILKDHVCTNGWIPLGGGSHVVWVQKQRPNKRVVRGASRSYPEATGKQRTTGDYEILR